MENLNQTPTHSEGTFQARVTRTLLTVLGVCVVLHVVQDVLHMFQFVDIIWVSLTLYLMFRLSSGHRDLDLGGQISFGRAFLVAWLPGLVGGLFAASAIYYSAKHVIKADLLKYIKDEKYLGELGNKFWIEVSEKVMTFDGYVMMLQYFSALFFIAALVIAFLVKRK